MYATLPYVVDKTKEIACTVEKKQKQKKSHTIAMIFHNPSSFSILFDVGKTI